MPATSHDPQLYDTFVEIIARTTGWPVEDLAPDTSVRDLAIDSITAAEIVSQAEDAAGGSISLHRILDDWSSLTVDGLVRALAEGATPRPGND